MKFRSWQFFGRKLTAAGATGVDEKYYLQAYPDVARAGVRPSEHFYSHGWKEGRNPSSTFHTLYYTSKYMPGSRLASNPLIHFLEDGPTGLGPLLPESQDEWMNIQKQKIAVLFDESFYVSNYAEQLGELDPLDHYLTVGWRIGCNPSKMFDTLAYLESHSHLLNSNVNPLYHWVVLCDAGIAPMSEGKALKPHLDRNNLLQTLAPHFDATYYLSKNRDVADAKLNPLVHFVDYGWKEGRDPSPSFWTAYYISKYPEAKGTNPLLHFALEGKARGYRSNPVGTESWARPVAPTEEQWLNAPATLVTKSARVNVIIPVYKGYDDTLATIYSVLVNKQKSCFNLFVVNDASPEPKLTEKLRGLASLNLFAYHENEQNIGFVATVNKALEFEPRCDVVLLNADTIVYGDWLDRILEHAQTHPDAATITPFSNNATICSYPQANQENFLALECSREQLDLYARACNVGRTTRIPTGVGFCFYMRRSVIDQIGAFDAIFGRGYGEENDFCMRALKAGYKNLLANDIFVYHSGKVSFTEFHIHEFEPGQKALSGKHPDYVRKIESFILADSAKDARARLDIFRQIRMMGPRSAVLVTINTGGGIVTHVNSLARRLEREGISVLFFYVSDDSIKIAPFDKSKQVFTPSLTEINIAKNTKFLGEILEWLAPELIHVHSFATLKWTPTVLLMDLLKQYHEGFVVTLHDYDTVCHRHHLVDLEGRYCQRVVLTECRECIKSDNARPDLPDPDCRRLAYHDLLKKARKVFVPSLDAKQRLLRAFPDIVFVVREHEEQLIVKKQLQLFQPFSPVRVSLIGAIGPHKGSDIIYSLALDAKTRSLPIKYSIAGYSPIPDKLREAGVCQSGRYNSDDQAVEALEYQTPHFALFPSIWPETYCYTLSISLALGLPPIVFNLGAQADRVKKAGFGVILDSSLALEPGALNDAILNLNVEEEWKKRRPICFHYYDSIIQDYYQITESE